MKNENNNPLLFSIIFSMNSYYDHEITLEDIRYLYNIKVRKCQINLYKHIIQMLSSGYSYEKISEYLDNINVDEYQNLSMDEQNYIQKKLRRDIKLRKNNENKNRGVINNE